MKTAKEFIEKLQNDEAFAKQVNEGIEAKKAAGAKDYTEALIPTAAELGYQVSKDQVEALLAKQSEAVSEEELGKAAGGTSCVGMLLVTAISAVGVSIGVGTAAAEGNLGSASC